MNTDDPPTGDHGIQYMHSLLLLGLSLQTELATLFLLLLLIISSALISGSEVAFFSINKNQIKDLIENGSSSSQKIVQLLDRPRRLLASILIANNFINIAIVIVSDYLIWNWISEEIFTNWADRLSTGTPLLISETLLARILNFILTVGLITFILVLFGEVTPKVYANINGLTLARFMARPLYFIDRLISPFSNLLVAMSKSLESRLGNTFKTDVNKEEIDRAIELTVTQDKHTTQEIDILKSIMKFGDVTVKQIMCSRVDVVALDLKAPYSEVLEAIKESGYSRLPVFENDFDNVVGILYVKDLLGNLDQPNDFDWTQHLQDEILYVPENKRINELLKEFQQKHLHMGIVVDEFGGSAGLVTLEDVMEEVIGDIKDEFDQEKEVDYVKLNPNEYIFDGKSLLNDVCRITRLPIDSFDGIKGDADSIAGLFLELTGRMPIIGQEVKVGRFTFQVVAVSKRRIEKIKMILLK
ncbi:MAG: gliding motility-associated protein GldE [Bacteroidetes bacterium]|nr:gliding motility-associated protein GldE [Bacteroidota bacterium]